jgi:hypothetical protein
MSPVTRPEEGWEETRVTLRAANAAASTVVAFWTLFVVSTQISPVREHSPWAEDPYDAVVSFAALVVPVVAAVTFMRCQRWRGSRPMPAYAIRQILRGVGVALAGIGATVIVGVAALLAQVRAEPWGLWFGLLVLTGTLALCAAALHYGLPSRGGRRARRHRRFPRRRRGDSRTTFHLAGDGAHDRRASAGRCAAGLPVQPSSAFCAVVAAVFGATFST